MNEDFFEGKDFGKGDFKALMPKYYPRKYKRYIAQETSLLKRKINGATRVLEAGVGIGRLIPELAPIVTEFIGVDAASLMLAKSKEVSTRYSNTKIIKGNLEDLSKLFPKDYFEFSLCVWNTLGNVTDEVKVLKELFVVTSKSIFLTVYLKGTLEDRKAWYSSVDVPISTIDEKNEIFISASGLKSKSYTLDTITYLAKKAKLTVFEHKVLGGVILWVEFRKMF